jgi:hypothetical protein
MMKNLGRPSLNSNLHNSLTAWFRDPTQAFELFDELLRTKTYRQDFCLKLIAVAGSDANDWDLRRLATLMLENQVLRLRADQLDHFDQLLTRLHLKSRLGRTEPLAGSVLKEGYTTTDLKGFIPEFQRKLRRLDRLHGRLRGTRTSETALGDFINISRRDCRLSLARYLFTPDEIVDRIVNQLRLSEGLDDLDISEIELVAEERERALNALPKFEAGILKRLYEVSKIYWVSDTTSSEINSLIEYPLQTVALAIKPPGSDFEFEIKRVGRRGPNVLNVVFARGGYTVPPSHRLDGGCMQETLRYEACHSNRLARIFRLVHGHEAPMPDYLSRSTIYSIPFRGGEVQTLLYFTEPQFFGERYREMRLAMKESVNAWAAEGNVRLPDGPGPLALSAQFIGVSAPAQAIISRTSSFRLDKLAAYLSDSGAKIYFQDGLRVKYSNDDARRFADELLDEVLGVYQPPAVAYQTYEQYLGAAFAVAENRARANRTYLSLVEQIAKFWGTFLAIGGFSRGESFVGRNVGMRSVWVDGQWQVRIIFMDHDAMVIPWHDDGQFYAKGAIYNMVMDERYIWGRYNERRFATSEMGYLQSIYKIDVGSDLDVEGQRRARTVLRKAYKHTQRALLTNPELKQLFSKVFIDRLLVWDTLVAGYFRMNGDASVNARVRKDLKDMLAAKGYNSGAYRSYMGTIKRFRDFLERYSYLFEAGEIE